MKLKEKIKGLGFVQSLIALNNAIASLKLGFYKIWNKKKYGYFGKDVHIFGPLYITHYPGVYLYDHTNIYGDSKLIIAKNGGRFIMKKWSGAAMGLTVVTGNHTSYEPDGQWQKIHVQAPENNFEKDVIVHEDAWLAANVTLLAGTNVGRGAIVGAGSVCRSNIPPYAIVMGNPAKVVGFRFTPDEIVKHEAMLYPEDERLSLDMLEKNYDKYYNKRLKEIIQFVKL
jgi:acetyltransferase-like isoleucine patch superfamily enzyme